MAWKGSLGVLVLGLLVVLVALELGFPDEIEDGCSADGEFCLKTGCCRSEHTFCFQKNDYHAQCLRSCKPGIHPEDADQRPWSCKKLTPASAKATKKASMMPANEGWQSVLDQTPDVPGEPSDLFHFNWTSNASCTVSDDDIATYDRQGYIVMRQILDHAALDLLLADAKKLCRDQLKWKKVCHIEQIRWQVNRFRDFLFYSAIGCYVNAFIRGPGVRISTDGLFGTQYNKDKPVFFSYDYHTDQPMKGTGVLHGFPSRTKAAAIWFPFHDLDKDKTGGSIRFVEGYPVDNNTCKWHFCGGMTRPSKSVQRLEGREKAECFLRCMSQNACGVLGCHKFDQHTGEVIPNFKKGDAVIWHSDMPHATQPISLEGFERYSMTTRFVQSDATICDPSISCGGWMGCCKDILEAFRTGSLNHCFPQIFPVVLEHEAKAHYSQTAKHLQATQEEERMVHATPALDECLWRE